MRTNRRRECANACAFIQAIILLFVPIKVTIEEENGTFPRDPYIAPEFNEGFDQPVKKKIDEQINNLMKIRPVVRTSRIAIVQTSVSVRRKIFRFTDKQVLFAMLMTRVVK